jgi:hypothetical protein
MIPDDDFICKMKLRNRMALHTTSKGIVKLQHHIWYYLGTFNGAYFIFVECGDIGY